MKKNNDTKRSFGLHKLFGEPLKWWDWLILFAFMAFCFVSYEMRDLFHTAGCSYGFLKGHFLDFYDYLSACGTGEDGSAGLHASYMPTVYILFAIWNIPMRLFGIVKEATAQLGFIPIMWAKVLPCLCYFACGYTVFLIGKELGMHDRKGKLLFYAFLSNPVAIYGQFILGQYESFLVLSVLLGTLFWLRKKDLLFVLFFAIGVTFKYTAVVFFLPLLLLREKRIFRILFMTLGVFSLFALEFLLYMHSEAFMSYAFGVGGSGDNPAGYIFNAAYFTGFSLGGEISYKVYLTFIAFAFTIAWCYFTRGRDRAEEGRYAMFFLCLSGAALFCFSKWHPHWLMILVPFYTITAFMHKNTKIFMALDLLFMVLFVMFCTGYFVTVTDEVMLTKGIFKFILPGETVNAYAEMREYLSFIDQSILLSLLTAMLGVMAVFKHPAFLSEDVNSSAESSKGWILARYILGLLVFIVPSMLTVYYSVNPPKTSYTEERRQAFLGFSEGEVYEQTFVSAGNRIRKIKFPVSVGSSPDGVLVLKLTDGETVLYEESFDTSQLGEGELLTVQPDAILSSGNEYTITFGLEDAAPSSTVCILGFEDDGSYENTKIGGEEQDYHLDLLIYQ